MTKSKGIRIMGWIGYRLLGNIKVTPSGCFEWQKWRMPDGYPRMWAHGKMDRAHRVSYRLFRGPIPEGMLVLHKCDNPPCVNPAHLFLGTHADNSMDRDQKKRGAAGEKNGKAKLKNSEVVDISMAYGAGQRTSDLAKKYNVSEDTIRSVLNGEWYACVERTIFKSGRRKCPSTSA